MKTLLRAGRGGILCAAAWLMFTAPAPAHADPLGFGIQAVGTRSYFKFDAHPGRTVTGAVRVVSTSDRDRTILLRVADAGTGVTGGLVYDAKARPPRGTGRWIRLSRSSVTLPANGAVEVPFTARVPSGAAAGDNIAGIVVLGTPPRLKPGSRRLRFRLRFVSRLAVAVQFRVAGPLDRTLSMRDAAIHVAPVGATLGLGLVSTGNALIARTTGELRVFQHGRELFRESVDIGAFVPGTAITYPIPWPGRPVEGEYQVRGTLRPAGGSPVRIDRTVRFDSGQIDRYRRETGRPAVGAPAVPLLLVAAAVAGAAIAGVAAGRARVLR